MLPDHHPILILALEDLFSFAALIIMFVIGLIGQVINSLKKKGQEPQEEIVDFNIEELLERDRQLAAPIAVPVAPKTSVPPPVALKAAPQVMEPPASASPPFPAPQNRPLIAKSRSRVSSSTRSAIRKQVRSPSSLRQAFLLSEILASPVSLRDTTSADR
ncbi:MAG: hypothetical protein MI923_28360 [Phycisphaerales bacterium]|nr:hypothetical protein [Phycisphaerales bacterium]